MAWLATFYTVENNAVLAPYTHRYPRIRADKNLKQENLASTWAVHNLHLLDPPDQAK